MQKNTPRFDQTSFTCLVFLEMEAKRNETLQTHTFYGMKLHRKVHSLKETMQNFETKHFTIKLETCFCIFHIFFSFAKQWKQGLIVK